MLDKIYDAVFSVLGFGELWMSRKGKIVFFRWLPDRHNVINFCVSELDVLSAKYPDQFMAVYALDAREKYRLKFPQQPPQGTTRKDE